jgi:hypothetical protein
MGAGYSIGLRGHLRDAAPKYEIIDIISEFARQGYLRRFVEVIDNEVYFFDGMVEPVAQKCSDDAIRTKIINFYHCAPSGSMPYSDISTLVGVCCGDTLGGLTEKVKADFGRFGPNRVPFEYSRQRELGDIYPALWELRDAVRSKKSSYSPEDIEALTHPYEVLKAVTGFYKETGYMFLVVIGDW